MVVARVRRTIEERGLIEPGMRVLAACSGGPDSGAMLVALGCLSARLGFDLQAASVDHGLRQDAQRDVAAARSQAQAVGVPFHSLTVEVVGGASVQSRARAARYAALQQLAERIAADRIAVGHTRDDQAETVLMRMMRGAGLGGLGAIDPRRDDGVIRPMIDCDRSQTEAYASRHCPRIARDPSNLEGRFERVRVRRTVVPVLSAEDPSLIEHLCDLADDARELQAFLAHSATEALQRCQRSSQAIDALSLVRESRAVRCAVLRLWVGRAVGIALGRAHLLQLDRALHKRAEGARVEVWLPREFVVFAGAGGTLELATRVAPAASP